MTIEYKIITDTSNPLCGKTYEETLTEIKRNGLLLRYVEQQTSELCEAAMGENVFAIRFAKYKPYKSCLTAVEQYGALITYIEEQTPELCLTAVQVNGYALRYVNEQTLEICKAALDQTTQALTFVQPRFYKELGIVLLAEHVMYIDWKLIYYKDKYCSGDLNPLTSKEALTYWESQKPREKQLATLFCNAIIKHQKSLTN